MSPELYRICAFRYLFVLSFGCFLFYQTKDKIYKNRIWYCLIGLVGVGYIITFNYTSIKPMITHFWTVTSVFAVLYLVPIMMLLIGRTEWHNDFLELIGKASYNICLVQMVFFLVGDSIVYRVVQNTPLRVMINCVICCIIGVIFYQIESPITKRIISFLQSPNMQV